MVRKRDIFLSFPFLAGLLFGPDASFLFGAGLRFSGLASASGGLFGDTSRLGGLRLALLRQ